MSSVIRLIALTGAVLFLLPASSVTNAASDMAQLNVMIVPFFSHLLGIIGSVYLAAQLNMVAERASKTWKYLSISIVLFSLWNILMAFNITLKVLYIGNQVSYNLIYLIKVIDPILEAFVFVMFYYGMKKVTNAMRCKPWAVFSKEDSDD